MQQFYIYDDNSSQPLMDVLWPYIDAGVVEYSYFKGWQKPPPGNGFRDTKQYHAYDDCAARCAAVRCKHQPSSDALPCAMHASAMQNMHPRHPHA